MRAAARPPGRPGTSARHGVSSDVAGAGRCAMSRKSRRSAGRRLAVMKWRNGSAGETQPLHLADAGPAASGSSPVVQAWSSTGCMTKNVRNSASPISTMLGGVLCVASALRSSDSTMTMRVKAVTITSRLGASDSTVTSAVICTRRLVAPAWPARAEIDVDRLRVRHRRQQRQQATARMRDRIMTAGGSRSSQPTTTSCAPPVSSSTRRSSHLIRWSRRRASSASTSCTTAIRRWPGGVPCRQTCAARPASQINPSTATKATTTVRTEVIPIVPMTMTRPFAGRTNAAGHPDGAPRASKACDNASMEPDSAINLGRTRRPSSDGRSSALAHNRPIRRSRPARSIVRPDSARAQARPIVPVSSSASARTAAIGSYGLSWGIAAD